MPGMPAGILRGHDIEHRYLQWSLIKMFVVFPITGRDITVHEPSLLGFHASRMHGGHDSENAFTLGTQPESMVRPWFTTSGNWSMFSRSNSENPPKLWNTKNPGASTVSGASLHYRPKSGVNS
ncbi:hypothetical protein TWF718_009893 [Orbilia javanica]|uniref:Uncharacterized protein n=1 Tax=Orbilia javanica TaxID=47235 RepID=A0AAN8RBS6_9PEZI